jgi:thiosulfate dehydrogenase [quinone] large subunit
VSVINSQGLAVGGTNVPEPRPAGSTLASEASMGHRLGYLGLRLCLGLGFMLHGVARIFFGNYQPYLTEYMKRMVGSPLPTELIRPFLMTLPFIEALIGFLLLIGLLTRYVAFGCSLVMLSLLFGTGLRQDWNGMQTQLIYTFFLTYLLMNIEWNHWSVDRLLRPKR